MKKTAKQKALFSLMIFFIILIAITFVGIQAIKKSKLESLDLEDMRAMSYEQITDKDSKVNGTDCVQFSAYFTRDLNGDGKAEKLLGTCREIDSTDTLYLDLNVLTEGYLKDGKITLNTKNFTNRMNMWKDTVLAKDYVANNVKTIELNDVYAGTQKYITGEIHSSIGNDINNYSNINSVTFTGTHVADDGTETKIEKTIELKVDWYGDTKASLSGGTASYYIDEAKNMTYVTFNYTLRETKEKLLLKETESKVIIPELNGYEPTEVRCTNGNVEQSYDEATKTLTIKRTSECDENGIITNSLSRSNSYSIIVAYPKEAFESIKAYTTLTMSAEGYYTGYNNPNREFTNPYKSNIATGKATIIFKEKEPPTGYIYNFYVDYIGKKYHSRRKVDVISNQDIVDLYDSDEESYKNKEFIVKWTATRGTQGVVPSMIMSETNRAEKYGDTWDEETMDEYISNTGIYFSNTDEFLEDNGSISIYDNDTNALIKTFSKEELSNYTDKKPYKYDKAIKHIRVETTIAKLNSSLYVYNIKELDVNKVLDNFTKEEFKEVELITTYLTGICKIEGQSDGTKQDTDYAYFIHNDEVSISSIDISKKELRTDTTYDEKIYIKTTDSQLGDAKWKNGEFLVEIPKEIIFMEIKNITINNKNVEIVAWDLYQQDEKYFIKIITKNEEPTTYTITIDCTITPDPRETTTSKSVKLYSANQQCNNYYSSATDIYDVNNNNNTKEKVGTDSKSIYLQSPTSLITIEMLSNYNSNGEVTVAPDVAEVDKNTRKATVNVSVTNNYKETISDVVILGKIPFKGNTYVLSNDRDMGSDFTTIMEPTGITVPNELKNAKVYYTENEKPSKDVNDKSNGWKLKEDVTDFNEIKCYLIDLGQNSMNKGITYTFSYEINIPQGIVSLESYSDHAVYYNWHTEGGILETSTEPNKVGVKVVRKYDLELIKHKENFENKKVTGATYSILGVEKNGATTTKLITTKDDGIATLKDLYVGTQYTVKEIKAPNNYVLSDKVFEFKVIEEENGKLKLETTSKEITLNEQSEKISITTSDEPKYNLEIIKIDKANGAVLSDVIFVMNGRIYKTDANGKILLENLELNKEYTLKETKSLGYYRLNDITFKIAKDSTGKLTIETNNNELKKATIQNNEQNDLIQVNATLSNEKIPTYNLQILKVEENADEDDIEKLNKLQGAEFVLTYDDLNKNETYTTNENGTIDIPDLYQYVEGKNITGKYILQETKAPGGYANSAEEIEFVVQKKSENKLEIKIIDKDNLSTIKDMKIEENTIKLVIQNKPLFKLTKTDSETGKPLANAKFIIQEVNDSNTVIGYAKDTNGNYVGKKDGSRYIITTDETGIMNIPLRGGKYKITEVGFPEGYQENSNEQYFEVSGKKQTEAEEKNVIQINSIEDLVELSNTVNDGNSMSGKTVKLMRTLDFKDPNSYENPNSGLMNELNDTTSNGFSPIGKSSTPFSGIFDGQENEIKNIYINGQNSTTGLFGTVTHGAIKNLSITGSVTGYTNIGGIAGYSVNSRIQNCHNSATISGTRIMGYRADNTVGGIVGGGPAFSVINCSNSGEIEVDSYSSKAGGIVGELISGGVIEECYNTGDIIGTARASSNPGPLYIGGICGSGDSAGSISNCYNTGNLFKKGDQNIPATYIGGIFGGSVESAQRGFYSIRACYNTGDINIDGHCRCYAGGIIGHDKQGMVYNAFNSGNISVSGGTSNYYGPENVYAGGITGSKSTSTINKVYNIGNIITESSSKGAIGAISSGNVDNISKSYYLDSIKIEGTNVNKIGAAVSSDEMKTKDFYYLLNEDGIWKFNTDSYPRLQTASVELGKVTELNIQNTFKRLQITTDVIRPNDEHCGTITGEDEPAYEIVLYGKDNTKPIEMRPDEGYAISNITINGEKIDYKIKEDGTYLIEPGYFNKMKDNKHIVVTYTPIDQILTINKVDEKDSNLKLSGAKFKIEEIDTRPEIANEIGEIVNNDEDYFFTKDDEGKYTNNNQNASKTAKSYIPIDLTNATGKYILTINAEMSGYGNDKGYAIVTDTTDTPAYYESNGRVFSLSGEQEAKDYTITIEAGKLYYLHLVFNNSSISSFVLDTLTINSINLSLSSEDLLIIEETQATDSQGKITKELPHGKYKITEIEAPEGYVLDNTPHEVEVGKGKANSITVTNKQLSKVHVHHYLKGTGPEFNNEPVVLAEDELLPLKAIGEDYTTSPKMDIEGYSLIKDENDNYIKPANAIGKYKEEEQDIYYYYESPTKVSLTVHHYLEGTEQPLADDEHETYNIGEHYKTEPAKELLDRYKVVEVVGAEEQDIQKDEVVIYYYQLEYEAPYRIEHYYQNPKDHKEYLIDEDLTDILAPVAYDTVIETTEEHRKEKDNYQYKETVGSPLTIVKDEEKNVIKLYYDLKEYEYTVHYFYDGVEDTELIKTEKAQYLDEITKYKDELKEGFAFEKVKTLNEDREPLNELPLIISENKEDNVINVYYRTNYTITTECLRHEETYKDGSKKTVAGGKIKQLGDAIKNKDGETYEDVFKGDDSKGTITIIPDKGYEIVSVIIKDGKTGEVSETLDIESYAASDGIINLNAENNHFKKMQSDKHIQVEFRRKTNVIVKHLEKDTNKVLYITDEGAEYEEIVGVETDKYETSRKSIAYYKPAEVEAVKDGKKVKSTITYDAEGAENTAYSEEDEHLMFADTVTVTYWYERIPAGIVVRHIEINEEDIENGLTLDSGVELDAETIEGFVSLEEKTKRKIYDETTKDNEKYKNYISVNGPTSKDDDLIIINGAINEKTVTYKEDIVVEVRYYYERQYNVKTKLNKHKEIVDEVEKEIAGGKISGEGQASYEKINKMGYNNNPIEIEPDPGYRIKYITVNGEQIDITELEDKNHKVVLDKKYFNKVQEDKEVIVEFEKIPAKVIVEYRDIDTEEEISTSKTIEGHVLDEYDEKRIEVENYILSDPEPENNKGKMKEEDITIVYWYKKEFKITTDVIEHMETDSKGKVSEVKGGNITGEDEQPYEVVLRGKNNTKVIEIKPDNEYEIKEIQINGKAINYKKDKKIKTEENVITIPVSYFENMQEDKHITVEYKRLPAKVIIQYLEDGTEQELSKETTISGYVKEEYTTEPKEIDGYKIVKEKYPQNSKGIMGEETIIVKYYYKQIPQKSITTGDMIIVPVIVLLIGIPTFIFIKRKINKK